jgi:hypothetical protein
MKLRRALFVVALEHWAGRDVKVYQAIHADPAFDDPDHDTDDATVPTRHGRLNIQTLAGLTNEFLDTFRDSALKVTSPLSESIVIHLAGELNERADDDGAVGNRDARYMTAFAGQWPAGDPDDEHVAWVREAWKSVRPLSTGGNYLNFQTADEDEERVRATYGPNFDRLVEAKETYDPENLFRRNRNIRPRARAGRAGPA